MAFDHFRGRILSPDSVANCADVSISQVHRWIRARQIISVKLGYRITRIDGDSLANFLESRLSTPRSPRGKHAKPLIPETLVSA